MSWTIRITVAKEIFYFKIKTQSQVFWSDKNGVVGSKLSFK
jgi:hypothetical protein